MRRLPDWLRRVLGALVNAQATTPPPQLPPPVPYNPHAPPPPAPPPGGWPRSDAPADAPHITDDGLIADD